MHKIEKLAEIELKEYVEEELHENVRLLHAGKSLTLTVESKWEADWIVDNYENFDIEIEERCLQDCKESNHENCVKTWHVVISMET